MDPSPEFRDRVVRAHHAVGELIRSHEDVARDNHPERPREDVVARGDAAFLHALDALRDLFDPGEAPWSFRVFAQEVPVLLSWHHVREARRLRADERIRVLENLAGVRIRSQHVLEAWKVLDVQELRRWYGVSDAEAARPEVA